MALNVPPPVPFIFSSVCFVYLCVYVCFIKQTTCFYMLNGQLPPPGTAAPPPSVMSPLVDCEFNARCFCRRKIKNTPNWLLQLACLLLGLSLPLPAIINIIFVTCHAHCGTPAALVAAIFQLSLRHCDVFN